MGATEGFKMYKLIQLLNEYEVERKDGAKWDILDVEIVEKLRCLAISKSYGFIKWLVENKKVEWNNKDIAIKEGILGKSIDNYNSLLMLLAIQDNPIEFLISILK